MQRLIYTALIPLLINSVTASDNGIASDKTNRTRGSLSVQIDSLTQSVDDTTPKANVNSSTEIDSPYSPDSYNLAQLAEWNTKGRRTVDDDTTDHIECDDHPLFMSYASLLDPYMKKHRSMYSKAEETSFNQLLSQIGEDFKSILPTERYKIAQQFNILAMFKGGLTFIKIKGKGKKKRQEEVRCTLAERLRIGKNRHNPMQFQCAQIESGNITAEEAALNLYGSWTTEGVLDQRVKSCKWRLKSNGFNLYSWPDSEIVELLTIRSATPHVAKESTYSEDEIAELCKRIRKRGNRKSKYINNTAAPLLTKEWWKKGVLNEAIAECVEIV